MKMKWYNKLGIVMIMIPVAGVIIACLIVDPVAVLICCGIIGLVIGGAALAAAD